MPCRRNDRVGWVKRSAAPPRSLAAIGGTALRLTHPTFGHGNRVFWSAGTFPTPWPWACCGRRSFCPPRWPKAVRRRRFAPCYPTSGPTSATATFGFWPLGGVCCVVLFAHPLFWWLRRAIRSDQELLADAVAAGDHRQDYAEDLLRLIRQTTHPSPMAVSAAMGLWEGSSQLSRRIAMLLDETFRVEPTGSRRWKFRALGVLVLLGRGLFAGDFAARAFSWSTAANGKCRRSENGEEGGAGPGSSGPQGRTQSTA